MITALIAASALAGCASHPTDPWTAADTRRQIVTSVALGADAYTTAQFYRDPNARETFGLARDLWGPQPGLDDVFVGALVWGTVHYLIARRLPADLRRWWQYGFTFAHGKAAINNCRYNDIGC